MFKSARLKLTGWYLLIITLISLSFSVVIYRMLTVELDRVERMHRLRIEERFRLDPILIAETKNRIKLTLIMINGLILTGSAIAGYFLAGQTLQPIKVMIEDQSRFITDASHELRTPLTALKSEIEVNLRDKKLNLIQAKKLFQSNLEEVNGLQVLTDSLIQLTQPQKPVSSQLSLRSVVSQAVKKIQPLVRQKGIKLNSHVAGINLQGDSTALTKMLVIFLDNAVKYSPVNAKVSLTAAKTDGHALIKIKDEGMGISQKDLPHVFDRFFRADTSRSKNNIPGYGLGLAIAKQIINQHKGTVQVASRIKQGTVFTVKLPV